ARAALELDCNASEGELAARVRELRSKLEERGVPAALGREFDAHRVARAELSQDAERNRDLLRLEGDVLAGEEAEQIVRLGLERLTQRRALHLHGGRVELGPHPHARDVLQYYARSLPALDEVTADRSRSS